MQQNFFPSTTALNHLLQQAIAFHQQGQLQQARVLYQQILQQQPQHADALHLLGVIAYQLKQAEHAAQLILQAIQINPNNADAHSNLGNTLQELHRYQDALLCYDFALKINPNSADAHCNRGTVLYELQRYDEAIASYERALAIAPNYAEALRSRGIALTALTRYDEALASYQAVLKINPHHAAAWHNCGEVFSQLARYDEAIASYEQALAIHPQFVEALSNRGNVLGKLQRYDEAIASYDAALQISPEDVDILYNRSIVLNKLNRYHEAIASCDQALKRKADYAEAFFVRGNALNELKRYEEALGHYNQALKLKPDDAEIFNNRANTLKELKRYEEAFASYQSALTLKPDFVAVFYNRGNAFLDLKRYDEALSDYDYALKLDPNSVEALNNRGTVLKELKRYDEAISCYNQALAVNPQCAQTVYNRGVVLEKLKRYPEAIANYEHALRIKADYVNAQWNKGLCHLLLGEFTQGWQGYEWRWQMAELLNTPRDFSQPKWLGEHSLQHKTILLYAEQGLGDTLQFCRYVEKVKTLGATVLLEVQAELKTLLKSLSGVDILLAKGEILPDFDYHCPLLSLPLALKTTLATLPATVPYLFPEPEKTKFWQEKCSITDQPRVGLVWSGNPQFKGDADRSMALKQLTTLLATQSITFFCLQKEIRPQDVDFLKQYRNLYFLGEQLHDFSDTAALVAQMDLIITTCTSVAHLAGAMAKPSWVLLSYNADWRWLLEREDSPWYPATRLFRQQRHGDWLSVIEQVNQALNHQYSSVFYRDFNLMNYDHTANNPILGYYQLKKLRTALAISQGTKLLSALQHEAESTVSHDQTKRVTYLTNLFSHIHRSMFHDWKEQASVCHRPGAMTDANKRQEFRQVIACLVLDDHENHEDSAIFDNNGFVIKTADIAHRLAQFYLAMRRVRPFNYGNRITLDFFITMLGKLPAFKSVYEQEIDFRRIDAADAIALHNLSTGLEQINLAFEHALDPTRTKSLPNRGNGYGKWPENKKFIAGIPFLSHTTADGLCCLVAVNGGLVPLNSIKEEIFSAGKHFADYPLCDPNNLVGYLPGTEDLRASNKREIDGITMGENGAAPLFCLDINMLTGLRSPSHAELLELLKQCDGDKASLFKLANNLALKNKLIAVADGDERLERSVEIAYERLGKIIKILEEAKSALFAGKIPSLQPKLFVAMGGAGSGKTAVEEMAQAQCGDNFVIASLDEFRKKSDLYRVLTAANHHSDDYVYVEPFANKLRDMVASQAKKWCINILYDGTGIPYQPRYANIVAEFKQAEFETQMIAVDAFIVKPEERENELSRAGAIGSVKERFEKTGRALPWVITVYKHIRAPESFLFALEDQNLDKLSLFANDGEKDKHYLVAEEFDFSNKEVELLQNHQLAGTLCAHLQNLIKTHPQSTLRNLARADEAVCESLMARNPAFEENNVAYQIYPGKDDNRVLLIYNIARMVDFVKKRQLNPNAAGEEGLLHKPESLAFHVDPMAEKPWITRLQGSLA